MRQHGDRRQHDGHKSGWPICSHLWAPALANAVAGHRRGRPRRITAIGLLTGATISAPASSPCLTRRRQNPEKVQLRIGAPTTTTSNGSIWTCRWACSPASPARAAAPSSTTPARPRRPPPPATLSGPPCTAILALDHFDRIINVDRADRRTRLNPAYPGLLTPSRPLRRRAESQRPATGPLQFQRRADAARKPCQGDSLIRSRYFPARYTVTCDICHGKRCNRETLEIPLQGQETIFEGARSDRQAGLASFRRRAAGGPQALDTLMQVGLGCIPQPGARRATAGRAGPAGSAGPRTVQKRGRQPRHSHPSDEPTTVPALRRHRDAAQRAAPPRLRDRA